MSEIRSRRDVGEAHLEDDRLEKIPGPPGVRSARLTSPRAASRARAEDHKCAGADGKAAGKPDTKSAAGAETHS